MSRTSNKLLLGVLASMMVWLLVGADELDLAKQQDRAGFGPAARQVVDAQALQSVGARCRAETDAGIAVHHRPPPQTESGVASRHASYGAWLSVSTP